MKIALLFPVNIGRSGRFGWKWRAATAESSLFAYFHDCVQDARAHGYDYRLHGFGEKRVAGTGKEAHAGR